jgi:hypothetical protein
MLCRHELATSPSLKIVNRAGPFVVDLDGTVDVDSQHLGADPVAKMDSTVLVTSS